jgi:hypothetical protein
VHLKSHQKSLIPFNYQFRVLRFSPKEWEQYMVSLEQIFNLHHLAARLVLEHMISIQQVKHSVSLKVINAADTIVTTQSAASGTIAAPNLYSNATTQLGGDKGTLAGTLSPTGVPTVTAGGSGTTATAQRSIELSVFK